MTVTSYTRYREPASRGAAILDRARPGWAAEVDPGRLDMENCEDDILGQIYGTFARGFVALWDAGWPEVEVDENGFGVTVAADAADFRFACLALAAYWRDEIRSRLTPEPS